MKGGGIVSFIKLPSLRGLLQMVQPRGKRRAVLVREDNLACLGGRGVLDVLVAADQGDVQPELEACCQQPAFSRDDGPTEADGHFASKGGGVSKG
jgi:hypothetical protein